MTAICTAFVPASITASGLPVFLKDEVELKAEGGVEVFQIANNSNKNVDIFPKSRAVVTNYRLLIVVYLSNAWSVWACQLNNISTVEDCNSFFHTSSRMKVNFIDISSPVIYLKFTEGGREKFQDAMSKSLIKKSWVLSSSNSSNFVTVFDKVQIEQTSPVLQTNTVTVTKTSNAGIGGILRRQEKERNEVDLITKDALNDLESLMQRGREVVAIVQRYAAYANSEAQGSESNSSDDNDGNPNDVNEMESIMQSIGIVSPVTKFSAGRMYHQQLARQIADILLQQDRLKSLGGMMTLIDLYCLYNKARGTELVSPDDLLAACKLCEEMQLKLKLRKFQNSGVVVIELTDLNYATLVNKIVDLATQRYSIFMNAQSNGISGYSSGGLLASHVSKALHMSLMIANEVLLYAEAEGYICRDDSIHGVEFYPNLFHSYTLQMHT